MELLILILGMCIGWIAREQHARRRLDRLMEKFHEEEEESELNPDDTIAVKLEKHGDSLIVYNKLNDSFVTQVKSKKEFYEYCETHFKGKIVFMNKDDHELLESL